MKYYTTSQHLDLVLDTHMFMCYVANPQSVRYFCRKDPSTKVTVYHNMREYTTAENKLLF